MKDSIPTSLDAKQRMLAKRIGKVYRPSTEASERFDSTISVDCYPWLSRRRGFAKRSAAVQPGSSLLSGAAQGG